MHLNELFLEKDQCPQWGLNSRPLVYKTSALPLSYRGDRVKKIPSIAWIAKNLVPIFQTKRDLQWVVYLLGQQAVSPQNCPQWGLNSRPLVYETSALPLSYRGDRKAMDSVPFRLLSQTSIPLSRLILPTLLDDPRTREALSSVPTNGTQANGT